MARKPTATKEKPAATEAARDAGPRPAAEGPTKEAPAHAADPRGKISVALGEFRGGPSMHLSRSRKFQQMQVRFDAWEPDEKTRAMLEEARWRDRAREEGVWTKQIDRDAKWQSVQRMEREFRAIANAAREGLGLGPVLEGRGA